MWIQKINIEEVLYRVRDNEVLEGSSMTCNKEHPLRVVTLCSGYDSQCLALKYLKDSHPDFEFDLVAWSEIDKSAITAHNVLFPEYKDRNLGDMSKIMWGGGCEDFDLLTYSTPCQSVSNAGKQEGLAEGSGTTSSLLWFTRNAIIEKKPKYLMMENVKGLVCKKFLPYFFAWLKELEEYGYTSYYRILNAKDYDVPQNRERIFVVSVRNDLDLSFSFPKPMLLRKVIKDILLDKVEEGYYVDKELSDNLIKMKCNDNRCARIIHIGDLPIGKKFGGKQKVFSVNGISPTLLVNMHKDPHNYGSTPKFVVNGRVRKITPFECFRLMGVHDNEIEKLEKSGLTKANRYKLSGNSIVTNCMTAIFEELLYPTGNSYVEKDGQLSLF